jgi:archaemetzincin
VPVPERTEVELTTFGAADGSLLAALAAAVGDLLGLPSSTGAVLPLPSGSLDAGRGQHRARVFLDDLAANRETEDSVPLGLTSLDLFVPRLSFVFGAADRRLRVAVVSLARLDPAFYGAGPDRELLLERAKKEAVHELGHVLGLDHCRRPSCVMFFSNTIDDTDRKGTELCESCSWKRADLA